MGPLVRDTYERVHDAITALGAEIGAARVEDNAHLTQYAFTTTDIAQALRWAGQAVDGHPITVAITLDIDGADLVLVPSRNGCWTIEGDSAVFAWNDDNDPPGTDELVDHWMETQLQGKATVRVKVGKEQWVDDLQRATGVTAWVGYDLAGFVAWLTSTHPNATLGLLLRNSSAVVALATWEGPPINLGPLTLGDLDPPPPSIDYVPEWLEDSQEWHRRALTVDVADAPNTVVAPLAAAATWAAVALIAEQVDTDEARPSRDHTTRWQRTPFPPGADRRETALVRVALWIAAEPNLTRLTIARRVAAQVIDAPYRPASAAVIETCDIAYRQTIDQTVQAALGRQVELEQAYRGIDAELSLVRSSLVQSLDQTIVRAVVGIIAIAAALVAADEQSPGLIWFAAIVAAGYLLFSGIVEMEMVRRDASARAVGFRDVLMSRGDHLAATAVSVVNQWETDVRTRAVVVRWILAATAVFLVLAAWIVAASVQDDPPTAPRPTTTTSQ